MGAYLGGLVIGAAGAIIGAAGAILEAVGRAISDNLSKLQIPGPPAKISKVASLGAGSTVNAVGAGLPSRKVRGSASYGGVSENAMGVVDIDGIYFYKPTPDSICDVPLGSYETWSIPIEMHNEFTPVAVYDENTRILTDRLLQFAMGDVIAGINNLKSTPWFGSFLLFSKMPTLDSVFYNFDHGENSNARHIQWLYVGDGGIYTNEQINYYQIGYALQLLGDSLGTVFIRVEVWNRQPGWTPAKPGEKIWAGYGFVDAPLWKNGIYPIP